MLVSSGPHTIRHTFTLLKWFNVELPGLLWTSIVIMKVFPKCLTLSGGTHWKTGATSSEQLWCTKSFINLWISNLATILLLAISLPEDTITGFASYQRILTLTSIHFSWHNKDLEQPNRTYCGSFHSTAIHGGLTFNLTLDAPFNNYSLLARSTHTYICTTLLTNEVCTLMIIIIKKCLNIKQSFHLHILFSNAVSWSWSTRPFLYPFSRSHSA